MKSWRTTLAGIIAALVAASPAFLHYLAGGFAAVTTADIGLVGALLTVLFGLFNAKDKQTTGSQ